jgi:peroxiredoxin
MKNPKQLTFNSIAPDLQVHDTEGQIVQLSDLWQHNSLLLAFTRHFGCTQCKEMLDELVAGQQQIKKAGLSIVVITQGTPQSTALFAEKFAPGLLCLADPERKAYQAYGLEHGNLFQTFLNARVWAAIRRSRQKGYKVETPPQGQDAMLMSGTFIISQKGRVLLPYYYDNIADHPSLELFIRGVLDTTWDQSYEGPIGPFGKKH